MATLSRWDPFGDMQRLTEQMLRGWTGELEGRTFAPAVDVYEDADAIYLEAQLPGLKADDISIDIENNVLTIRGERKLEREEKREGYRRIESSFGAFSRSFALPEAAITDSVEAEMEHGVLKLRIPKEAEATTKHIPVKSRAGGQEEKEVVSAAERREEVSGSKSEEPESQEGETQKK